MKRCLTIGLCMLSLACTASADPAPLFEQRLGHSLPSTLRLRDADGSPVTLPGLLRSGRTLVLLPAYYRCDTLCGTVAHGALQALADSGIPARDWQLVLFSIDPLDTPAQASALRDVYTGYAHWARPTTYAGGVPLRMLSGEASQSRALAESIGFDWRVSSAGSGQSAPDLGHPAGLVVVTPEGVVSRYLFGVRFDPATLRDAMLEAHDGHIGNWVTRLSLVCAHLAPASGAGPWPLIRALAAACALGLLALTAAYVWRKSTRHGASHG